MMLGEQELLERYLLVELLELFPQQALLEQLLLEPERDRHLEGREAARRERDIGLQQPLEFQERLVVEGDVINPGEFCADRIQAIADRVMRERRIVLLAGKALLLRSRDDAAVLDQRG